MTTNPARPTATRRFPRFPLDIRVSAKVFRSDAAIDLWGRSIEMGQDGIGVTLTGELDVGEVATLELNLPATSTPLKLRALVRYRDGLRHGFEFLPETRSSGRSYAAPAICWLPGSRVAFHSCHCGRSRHSAKPNKSPSQSIAGRVTFYNRMHLTHLE